MRFFFAHIFLPAIMLLIGVLGLFFPEKVNKSRWTYKPFNYKMLNKNENTIKTATRVNCICLLVEESLLGILSIILTYHKIVFTGLEAMLLVVIMLLIIPNLFMVIIHIIKFDRDGNLRRNK